MARRHPRFADYDDTEARYWLCVEVVHAHPRILDRLTWIVGRHLDRVAGNSWLNSKLPSKISLSRASAQPFGVKRPIEARKAGIDSVGKRLPPRMISGKISRWPNNEAARWVEHQTCNSRNRLNRQMPLNVDQKIASGNALQGISKIVAPAINPSPEGAPPMIPFLFITIACGAISGFHGLVSSGTTSKQVGCATDARVIGYGGMLGEGSLGMLAVLASTAGFATFADWSKHYASWGAANGMAANDLGTSLAASGEMIASS